MGFYISVFVVVVAVNFIAVAIDAYLWFSGHATFSQYVWTRQFWPTVAGILIVLWQLVGALAIFLHLFVQKERGRQP